MSIKNRELSQFGSFIYIEDSNQSIGITTLSSPNVGIGTTNATHKLTVVGDTNISGVVSATGFYLNGLPLTDATVDRWSIGIGSDIYRQFGNVGVGSTVPQARLDVVENVRASQFISTVSSGTPPLIVSSTTQVSNLNASLVGGKNPPSGDFVGTTDGQILTNKTLNLSSNTLTGTTAQFNTALNDADFATLAGIETFANKTLTSPTVSGTVNFGAVTLSAPGTGSYTIAFPAESGTILTSSTGGVITGVVTTGNIQDGTILNQDIANNTIQNAKLVNSTISGVSLGSTLNNLTAGSFINYSSGSTYNGSATITVSVAATTLNTANTIVARDASGDFNAGTINCANLNATFDVNSNSDLNLKENIQTVQNPLDIVDSLRGVTFNWKETQKSSIGVVAQELEKVLPQLVSYNGENRAVNYNGLIGVLIEAIKELKAEIEELKNAK